MTTNKKLKLKYRFLLWLFKIKSEDFKTLDDKTVVVWLDEDCNRFLIIPRKDLEI